MGTLVDLSHTIEDGQVTYKGLPAPIICDFLSREASRAHYAPGTEFQIARIDMVANTGTYIDCPSHRYADGADLSGVALERFVDLPAVIVRATERHGRGISPDVFERVNVTGKAVLVHTGWSDHWGSDRYFEGHPFLTHATAAYLRDAGAVLVGIDSYNIDDTADGSRPVHSILLREGILIVEHLTNLAAVGNADRLSFTAVPPKFRRVGTFPVRAHVKLHG